MKLRIRALVALQVATRLAAEVRHCQRAHRPSRSVTRVKVPEATASEIYHGKDCGLPPPVTAAPTPAGLLRLPAPIPIPADIPKPQRRRFPAGNRTITFLSAHNDFKYSIRSVVSCSESSPSPLTRPGRCRSLTTLFKSRARPLCSNLTLRYTPTKDGVL